MTTFFINSATGSDNTDGSIGSPWATAAKAVASSTSSDILSFSGTISGGDPGGQLMYPTTGDVRLGSNYGGSGDPQTGELDLPSPNVVLNGTQFDSGSQTGNMVLPMTTQVLLGTTFGSNSSQTGAVDLPSVNDVRNGVNFGANDSIQGTLVVPSVSDVKLGVGFDSNGSSTGTYGGSTPASTNNRNRY